MSPTDGPRRPPRSQKARSEATKKLVLEATLRAIGRRGHADFSLQDIADQAKISRGAITHHFPSRRELIFAAVAYFGEWRQRQVSAAFQEGPAPSARACLDRIWQIFQVVFPTTFEILIALRADPALEARLGQEKPGLKPQILDDYTDLFETVFPGLPPAGQALLMAFYRGLYFEALLRPQELIDKSRATFEDLVLTNLTPPPSDFRDPGE